MEPDAPERSGTPDRSGTPRPMERRTAGQVRAAPAARALARARGLDLASLAGTGPGGTITREDVERASAPAPSATSARRSMAAAMSRANAVVPATLMEGADITAWHTPEAKIMLRLIRAVCAAARAEPALNRWYDPDGAFGTQPPGVHLGIAVDAPTGLYVPVLSRADTASPDDLRVRLDELIAAVRARKPLSDPRAVATMTLSNFGPIGGRHASLVVTPPQVAILGAGRAREIAGWKDGTAQRVVELPLSLTIDHRAATGGDAARVMAAVVADLQEPA
mgnify:CR=1 FL=1